MISCGFDIAYVKQKGTVIMNKITITLTALAAMTTLAISSAPVFAEDTTEAVTTSAAEVVTDVTTALTASDTTTTTAVSTIAGDTTTLQDDSNDIDHFAQWSGSGDVSLTIDLVHGGDSGIGAFQYLSLNDEPIDSSYYSFSQDGGNSITITFHEYYLKTLEPAGYFFTGQFENGWIKPLVVLNIPNEDPEKPIDKSIGDVAAAATEEPKDSTTVSAKSVSENSTPVASPKTGTSDIGAVTALMALSGMTAFVARKRK